MMKSIFQKKVLLVLAGLVAITAAWRLLWPDDKIDFSTQVKPILNKKCISCHGGVKAKGGFSVLFREEAVAVTESGRPAIIPGDPAGSEMIRRLTSNDPEERMPYKHEALSKDEISILTRWIRQGAQWGDHWAYLPVQETPAPPENDAWVRNDVDRFILQALKQEKLTPSAAADKSTLLRRVSLDLIGLYPSDTLAQRFLSSGNDSLSYEQLVDSLLASPRYGERWASMWLDLSRYADTKGYESDGGREIWKYRDWVIDAFNKDMPYDQFLTQQLAGDLLPNPSDADYIATAFSRNSMTNDEGGTSNEEFRNAAVMDRVNTTWEALMSTTFACVQCHSHPYDPFRHDEYYKFFAFFNNTRDEDIPAEYPLLREFNDTLKGELDAVVNWVKQHGSADEARQTSLFLRTWQPSINSVNADSLNAVSAIGNGNTSLFFRNHSQARLHKVDLNNASELIWNFYSNKKSGVLQLRLDRPDGPLLTSIPIKANEKWRIESAVFPRQTGIHDVWLSYENPSLGAKEAEDFVVIFDWLAFRPALPGEGKPGYELQKRNFWKLLTAQVPTTPVMVENPAGMWRSTHVFERGNWRSLGKEVQPAVPASLAYAWPAGAPASRVGLSQWLTSKKHPLVSRTIINRLWEQLFGTGITETLEDMGTQGLPPTHRQLLDHLSWKLMHIYNWSLKKMLKEMVMSATYRQDSRVTEEQKEKDLFNKWYARGPRVRLTAEQLRDQHLCISAALSTKMYGKGVMPWQPDGIWLSPYNGARWQNSKGEDQYRRAVYTYWKRSSPYPSMITFDGAQRVVCSARRIRTNTPLQALVTLNDSVYINLARHFAGWMMEKSPGSADQQISAGYARMLYRPIAAAKLQTLKNLYIKALTVYQQDSEARKEMLGGELKEKTAEAAALVVVANAMLNLDEVVMKN